MMHTDTEAPVEATGCTGSVLPLFVPLRPVAADRRSRTRFSPDLAFTYRTLERRSRSGAGRVMNISSSGVLAACHDPLTVGTKVELTMEWPARLNGWIPLRLVMIGSIVRCEVSCFAVEASQLRLEPKRQSVVTDAPVRICETRAADRTISIARNPQRPFTSPKTSSR